MRDPSANTADPVVYDPPIQVEGPEKPLRGAIQFESSLGDEGGHKELIIRYNRDFDSTSNPTSAVYAQNFRVGLKNGDAQKVRFIPLQETGMIEEGGSMEVAYGEIRYRIEGQRPLAAEDLQNIELKYQDKTYPVNVSDAKVPAGAR
ncbi:MAG: hypothetical protein K8T25_06035 [Planctomycetia bacterium]|nr:hypothetical protein [Planctomycetia bacterium]